MLKERALTRSNNLRIISKINYEKSDHKYLRVNTGKLSLEQSMDKILRYVDIV